MSKKKNIKKEIQQEIEKATASITSFCRRLIRIPSVSEHEQNLQEYVAKYFQSLGLKVKMFEPDLSVLKKHPAFVPVRANYKNRPNVVAILEGKGNGRSLLLNAHSDTVPPGDLTQWSDDPWKGRIEGGKIFGLGACDTKAGLTAAVKAVEILLTMGLKLKGNVMLEIVVDEERGGNGTLASTLEGHTSDGAIFLEPTSCRFFLAHRGVWFWRIKLVGKGAHAGMKYRGVSAINKGMLICNCLAEWEKQRHRAVGKGHSLYKKYPLSTPINVGVFKSGEMPPAVPTTCVIEGTIEFLPGEDRQSIRRQFEQTIKECCASDSWLINNVPEIEWNSLTLEPAEIDAHHPLVKTLRKCFKDATGKNGETGALEAGCDMRLKVLYGSTPSLVFGPGQLENAHKPDEYVTVNELILATKVLALSILDWCELDLD